MEILVEVDWPLILLAVNAVVSTVWGIWVTRSIRRTNRKTTCLEGNQQWLLDRATCRASENNSQH